MCNEVVALPTDVVQDATVLINFLPQVRAHRTFDEALRFRFVDQRVEADSLTRLDHVKVHDQCLPQSVANG